MNYLVMECHRSYAVVLDNDGRFLKVANLGYEVGQKVDTIVEAETPSNVTPIHLNRHVKQVLVAVAGLLVFFLGSWPFFFQSFGTVQLQINPHVEISVNRLDYVIDLEGLNADGEELIDGVSIFGKKVKEVSHELTELAIDKGYLSEGGQISLTVSGKNDDWRVRTEDQLRHDLMADFENQFTIIIKSNNESAEPDSSTSESEIIHEIEIPSPPPVSAQPKPFEDDSDYDDTDYDDSLYGDSLYEFDDDSNYNDTDDDDLGESDYTDGDSVYDDSDYDVSDYNDSDYDDD